MSEPASPYLVGIDLGTTHSAISYVDADLSEGDAIAEHVLPIPQLVAPGEVEGRALLPSFLYTPHPDELNDAQKALPWPHEEAHAPLVGHAARALGAKSPSRLVSSAKSWLCHAGVDRRAPILPPDAPPEVPRVSPLDAQTRYLRHIVRAWDTAHPDAKLCDQDVTLTVPASFDPAARELTAEAASRAGIERLVLLEEPQAALYAWLLGTRGRWREQVREGDLLLVIDVGGGTTDLSLIAVSGEGGALTLRRVAVGDHILLGGDNMDLALAAIARAKLATQGHTLDAWQWNALVQACRAGKEQLLGGGAEDVAPIVVPSRGSKLIAGSLRTELTRAEARAAIVDGFFPEVPIDTKPTSRTRGALTQLGLPYAHDPAVTTHIAAFLSRHKNTEQNGTFLRPTAILFNGGVFKSEALRARVVSVITGWLEAGGSTAPRVLESADLDLACARGAAYYGYARREGGVRIRGGTAHSYYVGVESAMPAVPGLEPPLRALCVAPFGMEEGTSVTPSQEEFGLVIGEPVRFRFFASSVRRDDVVGTSLDRWNEGELEELPEIEATLPAEDHAPGDVVPVRIGAAVTEVGTLEVHAIPRGRDRRWRVALEVRNRES